MTEQIQRQKKELSFCMFPPGLASDSDNTVTPRGGWLKIKEMEMEGGE